MKNLYLLPTEKPSRLIWYTTGRYHLLKEPIFIDAPLKPSRHIYITSDEEIKEGDWCIEFTPNNEKITELFKCNEEQVLNISTGTDYKYKKIILTTHPDLIKNGVQSIDDEFLEWFIKNPNCEQINVEEVYFHGSGYYKASELSEQEREKYSFMKKYKIIIPKEESTFYTKKCKCMMFEPNCYTGMCKNCGGLPKEEPKTMFESLQEYFKNTSKEKVLEDWNEFQQLDEEGITVKEFLENQKQETFVNEKCFKCGRNQYSSRKPFCTDDFCNKDFYQKPKQETLEEAAKKYSENWEETTGLDYENTVPSEVNKLDFINGAKWQKEQNKNLYSEEEVRQMFNRYNEVIAHRDNEEWQAWIDKQFKKK